MSSVAGLATRRGEKEDERATGTRLYARQKIDWPAWTNGSYQGSALCLHEIDLDAFKRTYERAINKTDCFIITKYCVSFKHYS